MDNRDNSDQLADEINQLTPDDIKEIEQEPGGINDIAQQIPDKEKLDQLRKMIDGMPREQMTQLLANLMQKDGVNAVNPNNNVYSSTSKNDMLKNRLKQKIKEKQIGRMSNTAKENEKEKYMKKMQDMQEKMKQSTPSTDQQPNPTVHQCGDGCTHEHK